MSACTDTIVYECAKPEITRKDIAFLYAGAICFAAARIESPDWEKINLAILDRWSPSALEWIKLHALNIATGITPC